MEEAPPFTQIDLHVPRRLVKTLKTALETHGKLDRSRKIAPHGTSGTTDNAHANANDNNNNRSKNPVVDDINNSSPTCVDHHHPAAAAVVMVAVAPTPTAANEEATYVIPTTFTAPTPTLANADADAPSEPLKTALLEQIAMLAHRSSITLIHSTTATTTATADDDDDDDTEVAAPARRGKPASSRLAVAVEKWLLSLPALPLPALPPPKQQQQQEQQGPRRDERCAWVKRLRSSSPWSYTVYPPLLLLPRGTFAAEPWPRVLAAGLEAHLPALYARLCVEFHVTHVALNAPIPALSPSPGRRGSFPSFPSAGESEAMETPNVLRAPLALTPLYGSFGPSLPPGHEPSPADFSAAFWCTARQNGIFQTWAPRQTMFSRGNVSEKTRLLNLRSLTSDGLGARSVAEISAVDLYAGVGYFAFCYAKAGVGRVFCWEISAWSVEGLRRGAAGNGWEVRVEGKGGNEAVGEGYGDLGKEFHGGKRLIVYHESNEKAASRIVALRGGIPPVRHVNCGFLPTSEPSWEAAVQIVDPVEGGWIHAHENIEIRSFESRREEIVRLFCALVEKHHEGKREVECVHFEQVKNYAPGVVHCVLDISIMPPLCPRISSMPA